MSIPDPRIDSYIAKAAPFARPILKELRAAIHAASPDITETMKWSSPSFEYRGMLCGIAAFTAHVSFTFWKHELVMPKGQGRRDAGTIGRLTSVDEVPARSAIVTLVRKAMKLNEEGVRAPHMANRRRRKAIPVPADVKSALAENAKARATFEALPPSHRREYLEWITEAKQSATRDRRLAQAITWMAAGKSRNWQYAR
jgi:uncharacterized protein YdeI (YjbR/CyaY-like superfamily)